MTCDIILYYSNQNQRRTTCMQKYGYLILFKIKFKSKIFFKVHIAFMVLHQVGSTNVAVLIMGRLSLEYTQMYLTVSFFEIWK